MKFLKKNIVTILCIGVLVVLTFIEFVTYRARILFVSTLMFFVGGMLFTTIISRRMFLYSNSGKEIIFRMRSGIIIWIISAIILLYFGGLKYTGAFFLGLIIYAVSAVGYHGLKYGRKKKDADP